MKEYKKKHPKLYKEYMLEKKANSGLLKTLRKEPRFKIETMSGLHDVNSLQTRLKLAIADRHMGDGGSWIPVLYTGKDPNKKDRYGRPMGDSLDEATPQQRNAFYLQQEILIASVWEDFPYMFMTNEEWEHAIGTDLTEYKSKVWGDWLHD